MMDKHMPIRKMGEGRKCTLHDDCLERSNTKEEEIR